MLSTDIAPVFYRSNRGNFLATRTKGIPEREQALGTKKQPGQVRPPQGAKVLPCEFRSGVVATWRFWTECNSGACSLSRIGKNGIVQLVRRLAVGKSYSSILGLR